MSKRVAIVTGGNKGIGYATVRGLCKQFDGDVYLTARDTGRGDAAVADLKKEGLSPLFHPLDIDELSSIHKLRDFIQEKYQGLDILVNNAGIAYKGSSTAPFTEQAEVTVRTNFTGTLNVTNCLIPLLRPHARMVNVSSLVSFSALKRSGESVQSRMLQPLSIPEIDDLMREFVSEVKAGTFKEKGWPETAYGVSKAGVSLLSFAQQRQLDAKEDIVVNACCPGYVDTDMTSHQGHKTVDQGADTPLYLALLPPNVKSPRGEFVSDRTVKKWQI